MTAKELLLKLEKSCSDTSWGSTILYWARRHVEESGLSGDLRHGQPSSVEGWMKDNGFWSGTDTFSTCEDCKHLGKSVLRPSLGYYNCKKADHEGYMVQLGFYCKKWERKEQNANQPSHI